MIKNIYLHIGLHKTGSSSIQASLANSVTVLKGNGYLYPLFHCGYNHSVPFCSLFMDNPCKYHANISKGYTTEQDIEELHRAYIDQFECQLKDFGGDNLVLSGEGISRLNASQLSELKKFLYKKTGDQVKINVVVFIRNPLPAVKSMLQEDIKHGQVLNILCNDEKRITHDNFKKIFSQVLEVFSKERITVLRFEDAVQHPNGPVGKFLSIIGVDVELQKKINFTYANKSISYEALILQSAINAQLSMFVNGVINPERNGFNKNQIAKIPGQKIVLSTTLEKRIWELSEEDVSWLSVNFHFEKYTPPDKEIHSLIGAWSKETLQYVSQILFWLPSKIQKIIYNEIYYELLRYAEVLDDTSITELILFLQTHCQLLNNNAVLPFCPKYYSFYYKVIDMLGLLFLIKQYNKLYCRKIRESVHKILQKNDGRIQEAMKMNMGIFQFTL